MPLRSVFRLPGNPTLPAAAPHDSPENSPSASFDSGPHFLFATCQVKAEASSLKAEVRRLLPTARVAFSRPGFVTWKLPTGHGLTPDFELGSVLAGEYGFGCGALAGVSMDARVESAAEIAASLVKSTGPIARVHCWPRDPFTPGFRQFEPCLTPDSDRLAATTFRATRATLGGDFIIARFAIFDQ